MNEQPRHRSSTGAAVVFACVAAAWAEWRLLHPDPYFFSTWGGSTRTKYIAPLWTVRVLVALLPVVLAVLFVRRVRVPWGLVTLGALFGGLVAFPLVPRLLPSGPRPSDLAAYHPYLQYSPHPYVKRKDGPAVERVFFLGGSTTEWADATGRDWPSRVEEALVNAGLPNVEATNCGRRSYTTLHALVNYQVNLAVHRPTAVVVMHAINLG